jgi:glucose/arabinose dehydrogenase/PKD repeat protein
MHRISSLLGVALCLWCAACSEDSAPHEISATAQALTVQPGFQDQTVLSGLIKPTAVRFAKDGRIFIAEKSGLIKVFDPAIGGEPQVFADLRTNVYNYWDRGLLDLELHPDFPATPYMYVVYTYDGLLGGTAPRWGIAGATTDTCPTPPGPTISGCLAAGRLSRLEVGDEGMRGLEHVMIENWPQQFPGHSLGSVAFGPDGMLYVSAGDAASIDLLDYGQLGTTPNALGDPPVAEGEIQAPPAARGGAIRSQNDAIAGSPVHYNGKLLRLDAMTGGPAPGNPLEGTDVPGAAAIVAKGLRNPYRITFRPGTDEVWIGDVGMATWEEIDRLENPLGPVLENYGWPCYEGPDRQPAYAAAGLSACSELYASNGSSAPYYAYVHEDPVLADDECGAGGAAISGLAFYDTGVYPDAYDGALFFADYTRGCIWAMLAGDSGLPDPSRVQLFARGAPDPVQLLIGPGGDLYYTSLRGELHRVVALGQNSPPLVSVTATPSSGAVPLTAAFEAQATDPDPGDTLTYAWDLDGDGSFDDASGNSAAYVYGSAGERVATVRVTDSRGAIATASQTVSVGDASGGLQAVITQIAPQTFRVSDLVQFAGQGSDGTTPLPASALTWDLVVQHCPEIDHCHPHVVQSFEGVAAGSFVAPEHGYPYYLQLILRVTAADGRQATAVSRLDPLTAEIAIDSEPPGLPIALNQTAFATPRTATVVLGSLNTLTAPDLAGYTFTGWSDGGPQARVLNASESVALKASYQMSATPVALKTYGSIRVRVIPGGGAGATNPEVIRDDDYPVPGTNQWFRTYNTVTDDYSAKEDWVGYEFADPYVFSRVVFQEGGNFFDGGWFEQIGVRVRHNAVWTPVKRVTVTPPYPGTADERGFRSFRFDFESVVGDAIEVFGPAAGSAHFISIAELDVLGWRATVSPASTPLVRLVPPPKVVLAGDPVALDARQSFDPSGVPLTFEWTQLAGPAISLTDATTSSPRFVAPNVAGPTALTFQLIVRAGNRASAAVRVDITVFTLDAGPVDLSGRGSLLMSELTPLGLGNHDLEVIRDGIEPELGSGDPLGQYDTWAGPPGEVEGYVGYAFDRPFWLESLQFQEGLEYFDGGWFTSLSVEVRRNGRWVPIRQAQFEPAYPFANDGVGYETYAISFQPVLADAIRLIGRPGGAAQFFSVAELKVFARAAPAGNVAPVANAGADIVVPAGEIVQLDASGSFESDGTALSYAWSAAEGGSVTLRDSATSAASFRAPDVDSRTQLTLSLTVSDAAGATSTDDVVVYVDPEGAQDLSSLGAIIVSERHPVGGGTHDLELIRDGVMPGSQDTNILLQYDTVSANPMPLAWMGYLFPEEHLFDRVVYQEGQHFEDGGWFTSLGVEVRRGDVWRSVSGPRSTPAYPGADNGRNWQTFTLTFSPALGDAIRIVGPPGGSAAFITVAELRVWSP